MTKRKGSPSTWYYSDKGRENHDAILWDSQKEKLADEAKKTQKSMQNNMMNLSFTGANDGKKSKE